MHKEYELKVTREYTTSVFLKFPDDGRDHKTTINDKVLSGDDGLWALIAEKELEQMDIAHENWEINELKQQ
tara:strand:+ start:24 stop:236 length:213 start_codon:yes stop_codon:yes gene_type:complete